MEISSLNNQSLKKLVLNPSKKNFFFDTSILGRITFIDASMKAVSEIRWKTSVLIFIT
jgi:hypothetical protein